MIKVAQFTTTESDAFDSGSTACKEGKSKNANPYDRATNEVQYDFWDMGFQAIAEKYRDGGNGL